MNTESTMRILFLGFNLPDKEFQNVIKCDEGMPVQTNKFGWAIVRGLVNNGSQVDLLSTHPVMNYPNNRKILFKFARFYHNGGLGCLIPFVNILFFKHVSRFISVMFVGFYFLLKRKSQTILLHGVHSPYLLFGLIAKIVLGVKVVPIITDPPGILNGTDGYFSGVLKKIDSQIVYFILRRLSASIVLSELIAKDYIDNLPFLILEGISNVQSGSALSSVEKKQGFSVAYAGGIFEDYGVGCLLDAVIKLDGKVSLYLYGRGDYVDQVKSLSEQYPFINYGGYIEPNKLSHILKSFSLLINPRPIDKFFVRYSFPSKIIEYMSLCVPVATTNLPSIPEEYLDYLNVIPSTDCSQLANFILGLSMVPNYVLQEKADKGLNFIKEKKNSTFQGSRIISFLNSL